MNIPTTSAYRLNKQTKTLLANILCKHERAAVRQLLIQAELSGRVQAKPKQKAE
jgi:hypothetical protein